MGRKPDEKLMNKKRNIGKGRGERGPVCTEEGNDCEIFISPSTAIRDLKRGGEIERSPIDTALLQILHTKSLNDHINLEPTILH